MDPLTHLLDHPRAQGVFALRAVMRAPWSIDVRDGAALTVLVVTDGSALFSNGVIDVLLQPGELALIRGPESYRVGDEAASEPIAIIEPGQVCRTPAGADLSLTMSHGVRTWGNDEHGPNRMIIASYENASEAGRLVTDALPAVVHIPAGQIEQSLIDLLVREVTADAIAQTTLVDRLVDAVLISAVRWWVTTHPSKTPGWISATRDSAVAGALSAIHEHPEWVWTLAELARRSHVSRATLAARFRNQVGIPPMAYLTTWRLALGADLLTDPQRTLASIAESVGYGSPFSFSAAFTQRFGVSPAAYRRRKNERTVSAATVL
ncbi:AraC family transcriptional regulator [Okibacterium endophyticum]